MCILQASYQHNISDPPHLIPISQTHFGQGRVLLNISQYIQIKSETCYTISTHLFWSLSLPRAHADTNASLTRKVFHLRVNKLIASSGAPDGAECAAQLVSAPQESLPDVFQVVTRAEAAQSLATPGTEPVEPLLQLRPTGPQSLRLSRAADISADVLLLLLVLLSLRDSPRREDLAPGPGPEPGDRRG